MTKATKAMLIRNYDEFCNKPFNAGLGTIYKDWSDNKQRAYDRIKNKLNHDYLSVDLRCTYGNTFTFNCAAIVSDENNSYFMVFTANSLYMCYINKDNELVDENGTIFYS